MVVSCCAYGCTERFKKGTGIRFHSFPKDDNRREQWIAALKLETFTDESWRRLCSKHFLPEDYEQHFGVVTLTKTAVPSLFTSPEHFQKKPFKLRKRPRKDNTDDVSASTGQVVVKPAETKVTVKIEDFPSTSNQIMTELTSPPTIKIEYLPSTSSQEMTEPTSPPPVEIAYLPSTSSQEMTEPTSPPPIEIAYLPSISDQIIAEPISPSHSAPKKRRQEVYIGDFRSEDLCDHRVAKKLLWIAKRTTLKQQQTIKYLRNKNSRLQKRVKSLTDMVDHLKYCNNI